MATAEFEQSLQVGGSDRVGACATADSPGEGRGAPANRRQAEVPAIWPDAWSRRPRELVELTARIERLRERLQHGDPDMTADELQAAIDRAEEKRHELQALQGGA